MRIEIATLALASVLLVLGLGGCAGRGDKPNEVETVRVVYRDRLVPAPCTEKVTRPVDPLTGLTGALPDESSMIPEDFVDMLLLSDSVLRQYVPMLEKSAMACGVTIAD